MFDEAFENFDMNALEREMMDAEAWARRERGRADKKKTGAARQAVDEDPGAMSLASPWSEFSSREFEEREEILIGLERGEVGFTVAGTNVGKSTLSLNLGLTASVGGQFLPLIPERRCPRRILYVDGETRPARLKRDVDHMIYDWSENDRSMVANNFHIVCEASISDKPLELSNPLHMAALIREARCVRPDLIIIDTMSALFLLFNENDNSEMMRRVMLPLASLAKAADAALMVLHHHGKSSEQNQPSVRAYRGRGASASGAFARLVLLLTADNEDPGRVTLSCAKSKGSRFDDVVLQLDPNSRWFRAIAEAPACIRSTYELVLEEVRAAGMPLKRLEIETALKGRVTKSSITNALKRGIVRGDLLRLRHGLYVHPENAQMLSPIGDNI